MRKLLSLLLGGACLFVYGCSQMNEPAKEEVEVPISSSEQTQKVVEHHLNAFGENNLAEVMADYSEESILVTPDTIFVGLQQIEVFFTNLMPNFPTEGTQFNLTKMVIENDLGYIVWNAQTPTLNVSLGTDTYIVQGGKIKQQTFAGAIIPVSQEE